MDRYTLKTAICLLLLSGWFFTSCKTEEIMPLAEAPKNISGSWKVIKATRNGADITTDYDFTQFRVKFDSTGSYTLQNLLPFLVNTNGKYNLDDPKYPFQITFTPDGGTAVAVPFNYPTVTGVRQLNLTLVPGCTANTYIYTLQREN
jgi:hypothetical protein